jgi:hypothetical protein
LVSNPGSPAPVINSRAKATLGKGPERTIKLKLHTQTYGAKLTAHSPQTVYEDVKLNDKVNQSLR